MFVSVQGVCSHPSAQAEVRGELLCHSLPCSLESFSLNLGSKQAPRPSCPLPPHSTGLQMCKPRLVQTQVLTLEPQVLRLNHLPRPSFSFWLKRTPRVILEVWLNSWSAWNYISQFALQPVALRSCSVNRNRSVHLLHPCWKDCIPSTLLSSFGRLLLGQP